MTAAAGPEVPPPRGGAIAKRGWVAAIDGPAGSGKSTLARRLASALGLAYLNTGTMYRALALRALREGVDVGDGVRLAELASAIRFDLDRSASPPALRVDGAAPSGELSTSAVEAVVSPVSRHPEVRRVMRHRQRELGAEGGVVEGRDIGTAVFPDADLKVYLHADLTERAERRQAERGIAVEELADAIDRRDALDARVNPFVPAPDAHVVDTSGRDADQVLASVLRLVGDRAPSPGAP